MCKREAREKLGRDSKSWGMTALPRSKTGVTVSNGEGRVETKQLGLGQRTSAIQVWGSWGVTVKVRG